MNLSIISFRNIFNLESPRNSIENFLFLFFIKTFIGNTRRNSFLVTYRIKQECIIWMCLPRKDSSFCKGKTGIYDIFFMKLC